MRRTTGIPRSFITDEKKNELYVNNNAIGRSSQALPSFFFPPHRESKPVPTPVEKKPEIPDDLICSICKSLFTDAVMIPCCGSSFCDDCVRTALLESEDNECPDCHEKGSSPGSLIPNRFLRTSVNSFRNETGYNNRPRQQQQPPIAVAVVVAHSTQPPRAQTPPPHEEHEVRKTACEDYHPSPDNEDSQQTMSMPGEDQQGDGTPRSSPPLRKPHQRYSDNDGEDSDNNHGDRDVDESDEEDNITVTVPPAHQQSRTAFRDRQANGRSWGVRPEYERVAPRSNYNNPAYQMDQGRSSGGGGGIHPQQQEGDKDEHQSHRRSSRDDSHHNSGHDQMRQQQHHGPGGDHHHQQQQQHHSIQEGGSREGERYNRPMYNNNDQQQQQQQGPRSGYDNYHNNNATMPSGNSNSNNNMHPFHGQPQRMGYEGNSSNNNNHNMMGQPQHFNRGGPPGGFNNRFPNSNNMNYGMRGGPPSGPGGMGGGPPIRGPNPMNQQLSSIYQGVAAKVGTGIIDDPLEAFNRIMREKELRKEEERGRRSPNDQRRSRDRSVERARRRGSPPARRSPDTRMRTGERRRRSSSYSSSRSR